MRKERKRRGLQHKIFLSIIGLLVLSTVLHMVIATSQLLKQVQEATSTSMKQRQTMQDYAANVMSTEMASAMMEETRLQAVILNRFFYEMSLNTFLLASNLQWVYETGNSKGTELDLDLDKIVVGEPGFDINSDLFIVNAENVDLKDPEIAKELELVNKSGPLLKDMAQANFNYTYCFFVSKKGYIIFAGDTAQSMLDENGQIRHVPLDSLEWYDEEWGVYEVPYCIGVYEDPYIVEDAVVGFEGVKAHDELIGFAGLVIPFDILEQIHTAGDLQSNGHSCVINDEGQVVFSEMEDGLFAVKEEEADLRECENEEVAALVTKALNGESGVQPVTIDGYSYLLAYAYMNSVGWCRLELLDHERIDNAVEKMMLRFDEIAAEGSRNVWKTGGNSLVFSALMTVFVLLLAMVLAHLYGKKLVKPLASMTKGISELEGEDTFEIRPEYCTGDEVEQLAEAFSSLSDRTKLYIHEITEYTAERERLDTELSLGRRMQKNMLPKEFPAFPDRKDFEIYATMTPAKEVGGDFYDYWLLDEDHLVLVIADVSGKGVPGAMFMMVTRSVIRTYMLLEKTRKPSEILRDCNQWLCNNNEEEMFVTMWLAEMSLTDGTITACSAGHNKPVWAKDGSRFEILKDKHGLVLGASKKATYTDYEIKLDRGGILFQYTDGLVEATDADNNLFGSQQMVDSLNRRNNKSLKELLTGLQQDVDGFVGEVDQFDDLTMLAVRYNGKEET